MRLDRGFHDVVRLENLTVRHGKVVACANVSLAVPEGAVYALLGRAGAGKTTLVRCLLGLQKPAAGRALLFGEDAWKRRWRLRRRVATTPRELDDDRALLILDEAFPGFEIPRDPGRTALVTAADPAAVEPAATHVGILKEGRLVLDSSIAAIEAGFRRIHYVNRITETRTVFGTELDAFDAVQVRVRGWGIDAVVSNFDAEAFERFRSIDGVEEVEVRPMSLGEVFQALAGEHKPAP